METISRFLSKVNVTAEGCWEWTGAQTNGYGHFWSGVKYQSSHRFIFEYYYGELNPVLRINHLCRNRKCCNPIHLESVTVIESFLCFSNTVAGKNKRKTQCHKGHEFTPENTRFFNNGKNRQCKTCQIDNMIRYRERIIDK